MNYLYLALIPLLLIITGLICYFACFSEESYDPDKIPSKVTDGSKDLEQKEEKLPEQHGKKEEEKQKTLEHRKSMLLRLTRSLKKHPTKKYKEILERFSQLETEKKHKLLNSSVSFLSGLIQIGIYCMLTDDDEKRTNYLKSVEDIIEGIDALLNKIHFNGSKVPHIEDWYTISMSLIRLLATYEILGFDDKVKDICHKRILEITPEINVSFGVTRTGIELVWIAVPRLITTNLFAKDVYDAEVGSKCDALRAFMRDGTNLSDESPKDFVDGLYEDGSFIYNNLASYKPLIDLQTFYVEILKVLEFPTGIEDRVKGICNSMLHPDMDFVPFWLFDPEPTVTYQQTIVQYWPEFVKNADYNSQIFPVIGLGVFKSPDFFFSVRVQRAKIAAFESGDQTYESALGWIQIRKLFMKGVEYGFKENMTFQQLKKQPGVISLSGTDDSIPVVSNDLAGFKRRFVSVQKSYVGHFAVKGAGSVLYWMQTYTFLFWGSETSITECGVCTNNGIVMRHDVKHQCSKPLRFQVQDQDIDARLKANFYSEGLELTDGAFFIEKDKQTAIFSKHVKDQDVKPKEIIYDDTENCFKFEFGEKTFVVKTDGDFSVVIIDTEGPFIASGFPIWKKTHDYNHHGNKVTFKYNPGTKMFEKR